MPYGLDLNTFDRLLTPPTSLPLSIYLSLSLSFFLSPPPHLFFLCVCVCVGTDLRKKHSSASPLVTRDSLLR